VRLDLVATADRVITCTRAPRHPARIAWDELTEEKIAAMPLLGRLRPG
jgi:5-formyltetrahydrofolate cyclo-ligase